MLQLKRVDIQGFKSFYDRTEMRFHGSGVTAVVGPNGCGKSNLSDAISWVLGEQSAKSLRGSRMEDVIFAGTRDRKPLGLAQVTLTMADPHARRHVTSEITITRRLYRSGESEYLIDGKSARLRDIQDLFMGTGLGPESYAIIEQGRIGQILSNKPADRRAIIEEAAGIGKYKTRKRLAESKLESAKQNLARVFDILEEVSRQANSLKRQASKAKRYEELRTDMLTHLRRAVAGRFQMLESEAAKLALDLTQAQTSFQTLSAEVQTKEQEYARTQESCYQVEAALTESRARVAELNLEAERTRSRLALQAKQIGAIEERMASGETETRNLDERHQRESAELATHQENIAAIERDAAAARERLETKSQERDALQNHLRDREHQLESARQQVLRLLGEASALRNQLAQADEYLAAMERDAARSRKEEEGASSDIARLDQSRAELSTAPLRAPTGTRIPNRPPPPRRRRIQGPPAAHRRVPPEINRPARSPIQAKSPQRIAGRNSVAPRLHHRIGKAPLRPPHRRLPPPRRPSRFRRSHQPRMGARLRRIPARRTGIRRRPRLARRRTRHRSPARRLRRPGDFLGTPGVGESFGNRPRSLFGLRRLRHFA